MSRTLRNLFLDSRANISNTPRGLWDQSAHLEISCTLLWVSTLEYTITAGDLECLQSPRSYTLDTCDWHTEEYTFIHLNISTREVTYPVHSVQYQKSYTAKVLHTERVGFFPFLTVRVQRRGEEVPYLPPSKHSVLSTRVVWWATFFRFFGYICASIHSLGSFWGGFFWGPSWSMYVSRS